MGGRETRRVRGAACAVAAAGAALLVSGCTSDVRLPAPSPSSTSASPSGSATLPTTAEVFREARTFALSAGSGRVAGTLLRDGDAVTLEVEGTASGTNQTLRVTTDGVGSAEVLTVGNGYWLSGDEQFWVDRLGSARRAKAANGKYLPVSASEAAVVGDDTLRGILSDRRRQPAVAALEGDPDPVTADEVDGRAAWLLDGGVDGDDEDDSDDDADVDVEGARVWVAADGSAELLRIAVGGEAPADLVFTDWERAETFDSPAAADLVQE